METEDKKRFFEIMFGVADNFGGQVSKEGLRMRFDAMADLSIDQVSAAGTFLINQREKTYPSVPTVKEFRDAIEKLDGPVISREAKAQIQANWVLMELKAKGRDAELVFDDPITEKLMSKRWPYWSWWSTVTMTELEFWPKKFIDAYLAYDERDEAERVALPAGSNVVQLEDLAKRSVKAI